MTNTLVFDLETDGLLDTMTKIHCVGIYDCGTEEYEEYLADDLDGALARLDMADCIVGHNIIGFDIPAIQCLRPSWYPKAVVRDTIVCTRLIWPDTSDKDHKMFKNKKLPGNLIGSHSLKAWGYRIGVHKADYTGDFKVCDAEMLKYMKQDVITTAALWEKCKQTLPMGWDINVFDKQPRPGSDCLQLEHEIKGIAEFITKHGWRFDVKGAAFLVAKLKGVREGIEAQLQDAFPPFEVEEEFIPKVNNKKRGYVKGETFIKKKVVTFNPASRQQIGKRLMDLGWKPTEFGGNGHPTVDETTLKGLEKKIPEAKLLIDYLTIDKRIGQIEKGKQSWLHHERNGRIHGNINTGGTITGRMSHSSPNMGQVPAVYSPYGPECRSLFLPDEGQVLVGCDADGLELRLLAGYMANWDDGKYIDVVLKGDKEKGTDMHSQNAKAIGCDRDTAKTFFYGLIYGAGDFKLGTILGAGQKAGATGRANLMKALPALAALTKTVQRRFEQRGYLRGLDGRHLKPRGANSALNTLLQSAGAVIMKRAISNLYHDLTLCRGWRWGRDYTMVGLIHDEIQATVREDLADEYGRAAVSAIVAAGNYYSFRCDMDGEYKVGNSWKETH